MKQIFTFVGILFLPVLLSAQVKDRTEYQVDINSDQFFGGTSSVKIRANRRAYGIEGDRFIFKEFKKADVYFSNKTIAPDKSLNYDAYGDQVVYTDGSEKYVVDKSKIDFFNIRYDEDSSILFYKIPLFKEGAVVFMQVLYDGKYTLYKRHAKTLVVKDEQPSFNYGDRYANEYIKEESYYMSLPGTDRVRRIPASRRAFWKDMGGYSKQIKDFIRSEKISFRNDRDMIKLFQYLDELIEKGYPL